MKNEKKEISFYKQDGTPITGNSWLDLFDEIDVLNWWIEIEKDI